MNFLLLIYLNDGRGFFFFLYSAIFFKVFYKVDDRITLLYSLETVIPNGEEE